MTGSETDGAEHAEGIESQRFNQGAPNDQCQANHLGYVLKGKFGVRNGDGSEETAVMMPNVLKFAAEQGIELPAEGTASRPK